MQIKNILLTYARSFDNLYVVDYYKHMNIVYNTKIIRQTSDIDATKIENKLAWKADENFDSGILKIIEWYLNKYGVNK